MPSALLKNLRLERIIDPFLPLIAVIGALVVGAIALVLLEANPVEAYTEMISGAFANKNGLADTLVKAIPCCWWGWASLLPFGPA
jgi:simple sugar transport system permease protein